MLAAVKLEIWNKYNCSYMRVLLYNFISQSQKDVLFLKLSWTSTVANFVNKRVSAKKTPHFKDNVHTVIRCCRETEGLIAVERSKIQKCPE